MKEQSKQCTARGESALKRAKTVPSAGKMITSVFWYAHGIIFILLIISRRMRLHFVKKKVLFHYVNAPVPICVIVNAKINELKFVMVPHIPYLPDLAPSDYFLFTNLKKWLGSKIFTNNKGAAWSYF